MSGYHMGINMGHDRSAAIVKDGEILVAIGNERLDRMKHSVGFMLHSPGMPSQIQIPEESISYCLDYLGININDIATITANMPGKDYAPDILRRKYTKSIASKVRQIPSHHLAHAYSTYWPSKFDSAIVLVVDGSGSTFEQKGNRVTESYTLYCATNNKFTVLHRETAIAHLANLSTIGFVYEYIARLAGFISSIGRDLKIPESGKLMGLAPFGRPHHNLNRWFKTRENDYHIEISAYDIFLEIEALKKLYDDETSDRKPYLKPYIVDLAFKVQQELEQALIHLVKLAKKETGINKLCLAGGVALNSVANYKIYTELELEEIFIFPAAGDDGIAAGCAFWAYHTEEKGETRKALKYATLGKPYKDSEIQKAIDNFSDSINYEKYDDRQILSISATALAKGHIIARFSGGSEYGPRALGNRSIIVDPTFQKMKDILNVRVKFREAFRPFAPVIPKENLSTVFEIDIDVPFMLMVSKIKEEYRKILPAITHVDGTGRVQSLTREENNYFYSLCKAVEQIRQGPPVLLNTSFNVAGQPIVETPTEAIQTFLSTDIDYLCLGNYWISSKNKPVLDYEEHLEKIRDTPTPYPMLKEMRNVNGLMISLDKALFGGEIKNTLWSPEELKDISSKGAKFKETSSLFENAMMNDRLKTQISDRAIIFLDPLNRSSIVDLEGKIKTRFYDYQEIQLLLALQYSPKKNEKIRLDMQLTNLEFRKKISWGMDELGKYGANIHPDWKMNKLVDSELNKFYSRALMPFQNESFNLRKKLAEIDDKLKKYGYNEKEICDLIGVNSLQLIKPFYLHYYDQYVLPKNELGDLIRLFLLRVALPKQRIVELFDTNLFNVLVKIGILVSRSNCWASRIALFCVDGLLIATDHRYMFLEEDKIDEEPVMYIGMDSYGLVQTVPRKITTKTLDLCSGSGIQGIIASRYSKWVIGVDINPRAIRFARFNAQLNGVDNIEFKLGNLYQAVEGEKFDLILANPPFVPSPNQDYKFRDGGANGEEIVAQIVIKSSDYLQSSGRLYIVSDLVDVPHYQQKIETWWKGGLANTLILKTADRNDILFSVPHARIPFNQSYQDYTKELSSWIDNFHRAKLTAVNFGYILIQRLEEGCQDRYYCRTVNNPSAPIYDEVNDYFKNHILLCSEASNAKYLTLHEGLVIHFDYSVSVEEATYKLSIPHNQYFTTYTVSEKIYLGLLYIKDVKPQLQEFLNNSNQKWLYDLIYKGIIQLSDRKAIAQQKKIVKEESMAIAEQETKTTPTCLSSYLR